MNRISILLAALSLLPGMAAACCTAILCPYCISSSNSCVCGNETPVCNAFGCNCVNQCGAFAAGTDLKCYASSPCDSGAKARFDEVDGDKNGTISKEEAWVWARKQKNSLNVSKSDLPEILLAADAKPQDVVSIAFDKTDADGNGTISPAEFDSSLGDVGDVGEAAQN
ncbi:MAG TPA: hypothetical protein VNM67_02175 [Thermoanaerobaculia bacterium]|jgi:hypothetical protein|nr:hypothetical protein [Thermoanaerobaculia bacterium]